jgi:integrase
VGIVDAIAEECGAVTADRAKASLSALYAWAIDRGYTEVTPVLHIQRRASGKSRDRVLSEAELVSVWRACGELGEFGAIVRLLILTAQRRTEIGDLAWAEIDWERRQIELPGTRTKNHLPHLVPMSEEVARILSKHKTRRHIFGVGSGGFAGWSKSKRALDALLPTDIEHWTLHDIRRSAVTHMNERGIAQPHVVEAIVNHMSGAKKAVAGIYNKALYIDERRRALEAWAQHVLALVEGKTVSIVA